MEIDIKKVIGEFVDYLMPELSPHEASMYIFLLWNSHLGKSSSNIRIGQRTLAQKYGRGPKMSTPSRAHINRQIKTLEEKECIRKGDTNREGTLYEILLPSEIPFVVKKLIKSTVPIEDDFYHDLKKREKIYARDEWTCQYCGETVTSENVTLDHFVPQSKRGTHQKENLRTACLLCNSIKSGKTFEDASPDLLKSIQARRQKKSQGVK